MVALKGFKVADVFLLGAGFSKAVSNKMPVLTELSENLRRQVELPDYVTALGNNVEYWMTYLSQSHPWVSEVGNLQHKAAFLELTRHIDLVISDRERLAVEDGCPDWLMNLVNLWHEKQTAVITLNYDTLIERARYFVKDDTGNGLPLDSIYPVPMPDIRRTSVWASDKADTFKLFKLHGSVNWYYSGASSYFGETIYSGHLTGWGFPDNRVELDSREAASDKVPLIVPPTTEKVSYFQHETIRQIWARAGLSLMTPDRVFCIGYSLPETDLSLRFFLQHHHWGTKKVPMFLVNSDPKSPMHFRSLLGGHYDIRDTYVTRDNPVKRLVDDLMAAEEGQQIS